MDVSKQFLNVVPAKQLPVRLVKKDSDPTQQYLLIGDPSMDGLSKTGNPTAFYAPLSAFKPAHTNILAPAEVYCFGETKGAAPFSFKALSQSEEREYRTYKEAFNIGAGLGYYA